MKAARKIANGVYNGYKSLSFWAKFPVKVMKIKEIINKPSYYPEMQRKTKKEMWRDNFRWLCKDKELNSFYTSYGLDIKGFRDEKDFIPHREFCRIRNLGNQKVIRTNTGKYNYIALLRDKYVFASYLSSTIGKQYVVRSVGIADKNGLFLCEKDQWLGIDAVLNLSGSFVFKMIDGECGEGVFLVSIADGLLTVDKNTYSLAEFVTKYIRDSRWLIQPVIEQHEALLAFGTRSVNTIRAVTIRGKSGKISVFNAFLRLGSDADSFVDNRAMGGFGVGIDLETGMLMHYGFQHDRFGVKAEKHPLSGITFEGYQIPFWQETLDLIRRAHQQFYELQSIGWDVVITPSGPVLLEGNDDWEIGGPQDTYGGLKKRWDEQVNA